MSPPYYFDQGAPFWDFVADLQNQASANPQANPWVNGWGGFPFAPVPHRSGRHGHHGHGHPHGAPPQPPPQQSNAGEGQSQQQDQSAPTAGPSTTRNPPSPFSEQPAQDDNDTARRGQHYGPRRGHCGPRGRGGANANNPDSPFNPTANGLAALAEAFQSQLFGNQEQSNNTSTGDFKPEIDVFDTADSFVVHASLPGAKKEDVGVSWDAEASELCISGVVHRPGDEELLKSLAMDERKVGAFERKVVLGGKSSPTQIDVEGITAKMEDGVLRVEVPKMDGGFVEVKRVDVE